jgi:2-polyprenyl-6-methoxyphenol hydroxylase-like FAD-dependent oxidoreductase
VKKGIIIGAGIGGLSAALALLKKGIDVRIYEQASEMNEVGAGIWIAPNGLKVLEELGISDEVIASGKALTRVSIIDCKERPISVIETGQLMLKYKFTTIAIHRARLQKILASHIPANMIHFGKKFASYRQSGKMVTAEFADCTTEEADFLICADGIMSNGRLQLHSTLNLRYSGQTCWRFVTDFELANQEESNMYEIWSDRKGLRVGYSKINEKQVYVFITNYQKAGGKDNPRTIIGDLQVLCAGFPSIVKSLIDASNKERIIRTDLFDCKPIGPWTQKSVALMGDAAHATTPNLGQGACQAIEDAYIIAQQLSLSDDIGAAFRNFEAKRRKKASYITKTSWQFSQLTNTSGFTKTLLKTLIRLTPASVSGRQLDKIYSLES